MSRSPAHKMYAPFGTGALIGRRDTFLSGAPEYQGGGTVEIVTPDDVHWAGLPDREEAGSPNVIGAVAMAAAAQALMDGGMDAIAQHEAALTAYALERLRSVPAVTIYGPSNTGCAGDRVGVIAFNVGSIPHALVAAILGYEAGIGVRSGCFCAQPYVMRLLGIAEPDQARRHREYLAGDRSRKPGMVRISLGAYNVDGGHRCPGRHRGADCTGPVPGTVLRGARDRRLSGGRRRRRSLQDRHDTGHLKSSATTWRATFYDACAFAAAAADRWRADSRIPIPTRFIATTISVILSANVDTLSTWMIGNTDSTM